MVVCDRKSEFVTEGECMIRKKLHDRELGIF